jgi:hypothetical protein
MGRKVATVMPSPGSTTAEALNCQVFTVATWVRAQVSQMVFLVDQVAL